MCLSMFPYFLFVPASEKIHFIWMLVSVLCTEKFQFYLLCYFPDGKWLPLHSDEGEDERKSLHLRQMVALRNWIYIHIYIYMWHGQRKTSREYSRVTGTCKSVFVLYLYTFTRLSIKYYYIYAYTVDIEVWQKKHIHSQLQTIFRLFFLCSYQVSYLSFTSYFPHVFYMYFIIFSQRDRSAYRQNYSRHIDEFSIQPCSGVYTIAHIVACESA